MKSDSNPQAEKKPLNRRERRNNLRRTLPPPDAPLHRHEAPPQSRWKKICVSPLLWLGVVLAISAFLFLTYPRLTVSGPKSVTSGEPFQTSLLLKNDGYWPVRHIRYSLSMENVEFGKENSLTRAYSGVNETELAELRPRSSVIIPLTPFIDLLKQSFGIVLPPRAVTAAAISLHVTYRPYLVPYTFTQHLRYETKSRAAGEYPWSEKRDGR